MSKQRFKKGLTHAIADCKECGFYDQDYMKAQRRARQHANQSGHEVFIELCYIGKYWPKQREEGK